MPRRPREVTSTEEDERDTSHDEGKEKVAAAAGKKGHMEHRRTTAWQQSSPGKGSLREKEVLELQKPATGKVSLQQRSRWRNPWACSWLTLGSLFAAMALMGCIWQSFTTRQLDPKGAAMSFMASAFYHFPDFDTEHTRFATKYSLYLYREHGVDADDSRVKGVPVLFIPGNAGSYKQVRSLASEAAHYWAQNIRSNGEAAGDGKLALDFFTVDFNEDLTAFHGQTLLDQAEYLNDAIAYILSLYHDPKKSQKDPSFPDPSSVMLVGHSMGGIAARTMLTMPNYQANSVNTIVTLSAPHARPPVSFDSQIVSTYARINDYWRQAHSMQWGSDNPLWHVTLISIAGGGLDTIVPSDYSSLASLVPETHGFTVFTSTVPNVWTGMDHLAITWCDQVRKVVIGSLYDVMDASRAAQTKPRGVRMRAFKKWFLTGLEDVAERKLPHMEPKTLLTLEDNSNAIISQGERLVLRAFGQQGKKKAYLLPIPPQGTQDGRKFTLLTNHHLDASGENGTLEVLFCSVFPLQVGQSAALFSMNMDLSADSTGSTRLACKNAAADTIRLPASTANSKYPFDHTEPFSYLQYDLEDLVEHQFVAVVDKAHQPTSGWAIAEFSTGSETSVNSSIGYQDLASSGVAAKLPATRPLVMEVKVPALESGLLAYKLAISKQKCGKEQQLFEPLVRQYISDVYESKFFVNVHDAEINLHGVAPYMPPALRGHKHSRGLSLQIWSDPTCESPVDVSLSIDVLGSFGKLWMRYRTLFAVLPLVVVALALRQQFKVYDESGIFISFSESLNQCLYKSIPAVFLTLSGVAIYLAGKAQSQQHASPAWSSRHHGNATATPIDYTRNDLLLGSPDAFFWTLLPFFGLISVGLCIAINYTTLATTYLFAYVYAKVRTTVPKVEDERQNLPVFAVTSTRQRVITTAILLFLVSTVIPYQFAFLVLCIVQIASCVRALRIARETRADANYNFYNYAHSILTLMLWVLPINLPVLVVWIRNLAVHWLTPFSSHHNILSIMPYILLVETLSTGRMIPRVSAPSRAATQLLLFLLAGCAALYGVSYAYSLHHVVNLFCAWLVVLHWTTSTSSSTSLTFPYTRLYSSSASTSASTTPSSTGASTPTVATVEAEGAPGRRARKRP